MHLQALHLTWTEVIVSLGSVEKAEEFLFGCLGFGFLGCGLSWYGVLLLGFGWFLFCQQVCKSHWFITDTSETGSWEELFISFVRTYWWDSNIFKASIKSMQLCHAFITKWSDFWYKQTPFKAGIETSSTLNNDNLPKWQEERKVPYFRRDTFMGLNTMLKVTKL